MRRFLVIQTAFIGDAILTLPLIQVLKKLVPSASIDVVSIPRTSELFSAHPAIDRVLEFDKRGEDRGYEGLRRAVKRIQEGEYEAALIPHRSIRSALLGRMGRIPERIGFDRSAGWFLMTKTVRYEPSQHEIERNLGLLTPLGLRWTGRELPQLYPSRIDVETVDRFLKDSEALDHHPLVGVAAGSVWKTKRWLETRYVELVAKLAHNGSIVILVGGQEDAPLCEAIKAQAESPQVLIAAGRMSLLQSAELIRRCELLVTNDSAPMHLAVAMRTPVVAIFGSTVPEFGFAPYGERDVVIQTNGLSCRPCSIHGSQRCPIKTFVCMENISTAAVLERVEELLA
jgi:heptosyltransferase-2